MKAEELLKYGSIFEKYTEEAYKNAITGYSKKNVLISKTQLVYLIAAIPKLNKDNEASRILDLKTHLNSICCSKGITEERVIHEIKKLIELQESLFDLAQIAHEISTNQNKTL